MLDIHIYLYIFKSRRDLVFILLVRFLLESYTIIALYLQCEEWKFFKYFPFDLIELARFVESKCIFKRIQYIAAFPNRCFTATERNRCIKGYIKIRLRRNTRRLSDISMKVGWNLLQLNLHYYNTMLFSETYLQ
jgi:hypothetical protein